MSYTSWMLKAPHPLPTRMVNQCGNIGKLDEGKAGWKANSSDQPGSLMAEAKKFGSGLAITSAEYICIAAWRFLARQSIMEGWPACWCDRLGGRGVRRPTRRSCQYEARDPVGVRNPGNG